MQFLCRYKHSVKHFPVTLTESGVEMGGECFDTVDSFIQHFKTNPLFGDESGKYVCVCISISYAFLSRCLHCM